MSGARLIRYTSTSPVPSVPDTICLLDDEPSVLKAIGRLLASEGLPTEKFTEPARFLAYARSHPIRLAVVDVRMPGKSGFEVLAELQAASPRARVILITAEDDPTHRTAATAGGAHAFFLKPFDTAAFIAAIRAAISHETQIPLRRGFVRASGE